jgi:hypothetical protein
MEIDVSGEQNLKNMERKERRTVCRHFAIVNEKMNSKCNPFFPSPLNQIGYKLTATAEIFFSSVSALTEVQQQLFLKNISCQLALLFFISFAKTFHRCGLQSFLYIVCTLYCT